MRTARRNGRNTSPTELGWLKQDNIELDFIGVAAAAPSSSRAARSTSPIAATPISRAAALHGAPLKIIINDIIASPYAVFAKPAIKQIADLKGKLISIGGVNDITLHLYQAVPGVGRPEASDVDFVYAKAAGDRFSALVAGGVDATMLNPPTYFKAVALGLYQPRRDRTSAARYPLHGLGGQHDLGREEPRR